MRQLKDSFGRVHNYLRLSVTVAIYDAYTACLKKVWNSLRQKHFFPIMKWT